MPVGAGVERIRRIWPGWPRVARGWPTRCGRSQWCQVSHDQAGSPSVNASEGEGAVGVPGRPIGSFGVPDLALGEGAGGGCITFQRVGGRGCCRGARRLSARRVLVDPGGYRIFCGAGLSARRGCWWRLYDLPTRQRARVLSGCPRAYRIAGLELGCAVKGLGVPIPLRGSSRDLALGEGAGGGYVRGSCGWTRWAGDDAGDLAGFVPVEVDEVAELMSVGLPLPRARVASRRVEDEAVVAAEAAGEIPPGIVSDGGFDDGGRHDYEWAHSESRAREVDLSGRPEIGFGSFQSWRGNASDSD